LIPTRGIREKPFEREQDDEGKGRKRLPIDRQGRTRSPREKKVKTRGGGGKRRRPRAAPNDPPLGIPSLRRRKQARERFLPHMEKKGGRLD